MTFLVEFIIAGLLGTIFCIEWSFQQWNGFSTSSNKSSPLYINSREQIIKCCGVCANVPECLTVVLNNDHCICRSEIIPHASQVDNNMSVYVKRPKSCSAPGFIFINNLCIKVSSDQKTWHEAKLDCENNAGNLIILDSLEKHQRVYEMFSQYFDDIAARYFVGASDIGNEGNWTWIKENSSIYLHNTFFNDQDPGSSCTSADCGAFKFSANRLVDICCLDPKQYICEVMV